MSDLVVLFGQHTGKIDPRFPVQVTVVENGKSENYISMQEHNATVEELQEKLKAALRAALELVSADENSGELICHTYDTVEKALAANPPPGDK